MTIENLFNSAELAQAAYADLDDTKGVSHPDNIAALTDPDGAGMTQKQAEEFASRYTEVIAISEDPLGTGFSATVFASPTGQLTLAIRGTDEFPGIDYGDDLDIFNNGLAKEQILALANWWQKASNPTGTSVKQFSIESYREGIDTIPSGALFLSRTEGSGPVPIATNNYLIRSTDAVATGTLTAALAADSNHKVSVTGHSLGGHLAMAFGSLFSDATEAVTVFNAPGFKSSTTNQNFFQKLNGAKRFPTIDYLKGIKATRWKQAA